MKKKLLVVLYLSKASTKRKMGHKVNIYEGEKLGFCLLKAFLLLYYKWWKSIAKEPS